MSQALARTDFYTEDDYYNLPENVRAELIDGQFYDMAAPSRIHQEILSSLHLEIGNYLRSKKGSCKIYPAPFSVKLFDNRKTVVEPDISVICDPNKLTDQGCTGAPDWIIEIVSPSTSSHDYVRKLNLYMDAGVREYWIVDPVQRHIVVYYLEKTQFKMTTYTFQDKVKVNLYDDLWISLQELELSGT
ncbi:MAG: Uma2 family endonuclease [Lachnospiraceae bacterium]|nr:Uma2 family endonuclease [Lachnospiraceae bacterium]